ncbi:acyl-CoA synthetase [Hydrogenophilus thermoluteolus]|uniref:Acyl-CoA synthetase n=1 Tax=Hydrogenophilus thermoluteolus TaxID=297 RepID=A0A2Z6DXZ1_HYDTE|nr:acyl-CoA synthetase [Hydrogenophilus thermoluteolus]BBD77364.1 acyl-CoA synthetase [Hydrogenophilus thermoluteolus]HCO77372.1 acyl-CoA synthetase [Rhodocyclaceae bacterium]
MTKAYEVGLERCEANYVPLTPLSFLQRTAAVYPDRLAVIHGNRRYTWAQFAERARRLASALHHLGVGKNDTVAVVLNNTPEMLECHFGVPGAGAVLNTINTRLDPETVAFILEHGEAKVLITDREYAHTVKAALARIDRKILVIDVDDPEYSGPGELLGTLDYEGLLSGGDPNFAFRYPDDEWDAISLNYTSGTTGNPKGVVYHHRGAYLNALSNIVSWGMSHHSVYLWTLPMFHCNGWCFPWTVAANAGVNVCLRRVDPKWIWDAIETHGVTHYCGAPIVHSMIANAAPPAWKSGKAGRTVKGLIAAAPPPAAVLQAMAEIGFEITHVYGLTETYGPAAVCAKHDEWATLSLAEQVRLNGRQGVPYHAQEAISVLDPDTMQPVPRDGQTMGEVMFRGNLVMKGYLKNPAATEEAFRGGWFHTGDLGVLEPDGYVKIKDRAKDIIISGGENISSIEVEDALYKHPAVMAVAVVASPDPKWGEVPHAFIELREGASVTPEELQQHCRQFLAGYKIPKKFTFGPLPKTSTGKIQKFILREQARSQEAIE